MVVFSVKLCCNYCRDNPTLYLYTDLFFFNLLKNSTKRNLVQIANFICNLYYFNDKVRLIMWSVNVSEKEIKINLMDFFKYMNHLLSDFLKTVTFKFVMKCSLILKQTKGTYCK